MSAHTPYGPSTPIRLDGLTFFNDRQEHESAWFLNGGFRIMVGEIDQDERNAWQARKLVNNEMTPWRPMRCAAEARAFVVRGTLA